jgi:PKD repeat protein
LTGTDTAQVNIGVGDPPPVADAGGPYTGEPGLPVAFDGSGSSDSGSGTIESYDWDFGDGSTGSGVTVDHTYASEGIYNVTLTVTDNGGKVDSDGTTATITGPIPPVADPNGPYNALVGEDILFDGAGSTDADGTVVAWDWDFGDPNDPTPGTGVNPTHAYSEAGNYTVSLVVTDDDGLTSAAVTTTADITDGLTDPIADPNGPYAGTEGRELTFDGTASYDPDGGTIDSYDWDFGDGNTGVGPTPTNIYDTAGTYTVTLVVTDDEGAISLPAETTADIGIDAPPVANPNGPYSGTINEPVTFDGSASTDDFAIVAYDWDFGDPNDPTPGTGVDPQHTYTETGVYTVSLTVTDDVGQTDTATTTATIGDGNLPPVADAGGPYTADVDEVITFNGTGSTDPNGNETIVSYDWDFGDGTILLDAGPTPTHAYNKAGQYHVTLTVTDDFGVPDSDATTAKINSPGGGDGDAFLIHVNAPNTPTELVGTVLDRIVRVYGDSNVEQSTTVTLTFDAPVGASVQLTTDTITLDAVPGRPLTQYFFDVTLGCETEGVHEITWTATIDALENSNPNNDTRQDVTTLTCLPRL